VNKQAATAPWVRVCQSCGNTDTTTRGAVSPAITAGDDYWHDELERPWRWSCPGCGSTGAFRVEQPVVTADRIGAIQHRQARPRARLIPVRWWKLFQPRPQRIGCGRMSGGQAKARVVSQLAESASA
jgi:hypothetical protein